MNIVPALLTHSNQEFNFQLSRLIPHFNRFHIDIEDGIFVPNTTLQFEDVLKDCSLFPNIEIDLHLMIQNFEPLLKTITTYTNTVHIRTVLIHFSVLSNRTIEPLNELTMNKYKIGIVLDPLDTVTQLQSHYNLNTIEAIQVMTIQPGFQGQPFKPELLSKFDELRAAGYTGELLVDGSMNEKTIPLIKELKNKPDTVNVGSYLAKADAIEERIKELQQLLA